MPYTAKRRDTVLYPTQYFIRCSYSTLQSPEHDHRNRDSGGKFGVLVCIIAARIDTRKHGAIAPLPSSTQVPPPPPHSSQRITGAFSLSVSECPTPYGPTGPTWNGLPCRTPTLGESPKIRRRPDHIRTFGVIPKPNFILYPSFRAKCVSLSNDPSGPFNQSEGVHHALVRGLGFGAPP